MQRTNLDNIFFLFTLLFSAVVINIVASIHFMLVMLAGVLFTAFYTCLKKRYLYSLSFIVLTFLFIEINSGLKPLSLTLVSLFIYIFIIPKIDENIIYSSFNNYLYIVIFYLCLFISWTLFFGINFTNIKIIFINLFIDILFFWIFV